MRLIQDRLPKLGHQAVEVEEPPREDEGVVPLRPLARAPVPGELDAVVVGVVEVDRLVGAVVGGAADGQSRPAGVSRQQPSHGAPGSLGEVVEAGRACEYLTELNTACSWRDRQFRSLIEARVQGEIYELLLGWIDALPQLPDWQACQSGSCGFSGKLGDLGPGSSRRGSGPRGV